MEKLLDLKTINDLTKNNFISVVFPIYNASMFIDESIESILNQSYENFELILINDGSTDNSLEKCEKFSKSDSRIKIINNSHQGLTKSLNDGIKISSGKYIARQDADDISNLERFKIQIDWFMNSENRVLCGTNGNVVTSSGKITQNKAIEFHHNKIVKKLIYSNCFMHTSVMFLKSAAKKFNYYNQNLTFAQDYDLWWKLSSLGEVGNIPKKLVTVRRMAESITLKKANDQTNDFINSSIEYYKKRYKIGQLLDQNSKELKNINNHKKILQFFYSDSLDEKITFNNLTFKQRLLTFLYVKLYLRKISKYLR